MTCKNLIYHLGIFILLLSACSNQADREDQDTAGYIPQAPDYADSRMWYTRENNQVEQGADVFLHRLYLGEGLDDSRRQHLPLCRRV